GGGNAGRRQDVSRSHGWDESQQAAGDELPDDDIFREFGYAEGQPVLVFVVVAKRVCVACRPEGKAPGAAFSGNQLSRERMGEWTEDRGCEGRSGNVSGFRV